jgi:4-amino-4-deoxy-L-arabinose transferase-like glycosyltransferase
MDVPGDLYRPRRESLTFDLVFSFAVAVGIRLLAFHLLDDTLLHRFDRDPDGYAHIAMQVADGGIYARGLEGLTAYRPPGYVMMLVPFCGSPPDRWGIAGMHLLLGGLTAAATVTLARQCGLHLSAVLAGLIVAVDPSLVRQSTLLMSETLFTFLFTAAGCLTLASVQRRGWGWPILAGVFWGLAALTRPIAWPALAAAVASGWLLYRRGRLALVVLVALMTVLPWGIRNRGAMGSWIFTTTHGGYTLWLAQNPVYYHDVVVGKHATWPEESFQQWTKDNAIATPCMGEIQKDRFFQRQAVTWMASHPLQAARSMVHRIAALWNPWAHSAPSWARWPIACFYVVLFALALVGIKRGNLAVGGPTLGWMAVAFTLVHAVYWGDVRMRAPLTPILAILAVHGSISLMGNRESIRR